MGRMRSNRFSKKRRRGGGKTKRRRRGGRRKSRVKRRGGRRSRSRSHLGGTTCKCSAGNYPCMDFESCGSGPHGTCYLSGCEQYNQ